MSDFENRLLWLFKRGLILSDRSKLVDKNTLNTQLDAILQKDGELQFEKSVDNIFENFDNGSSKERESSITMSDLANDGDESEIVWRDDNLPPMLFQELYANLYAPFIIQHVKDSKLKVGVSVNEVAAHMKDMKDMTHQELEDKFASLLVTYCKTIIEERCKVALHMIYRDPNGEMARLLATVGKRRLVLDIPESRELSELIVSTMNEIRHSESFRRVIPLQEADLPSVEREIEMSDIFMGDELEWIRSKIDDVVSGVKRFKDYKKRKFSTTMDDDDIQCVLAMYMNCVKCTMSKMTNYSRKKLAAHKDAPSDFYRKYGGVLSRKGVMMLWNYVLVLNNMFTFLKEKMGKTRLSIETMQKMAMVISHEKQPDVKMAVINLLETIKNHMTKTSASFALEKEEVELVYQIISASNEKLLDEEVNTVNVESLKKYVSRLLSDRDDVTSSIQLSQLTKHIASTIPRLADIEISRINVFASSCQMDDVKEEVNDDAKEVDEDVEDLYERESENHDDSDDYVDDYVEEEDKKVKGDDVFQLPVSVMRENDVENDVEDDENEPDQSDGNGKGKKLIRNVMDDIISSRKRTIHNVGHDIGNYESDSDNESQNDDGDYAYDDRDDDE